MLSVQKECLLWFSGYLTVGEREEEKTESDSNPDHFLFFFFCPHKWCFSKRLASLLYGCVTLLDDNRICWECGPLLYPPYVTTWSDGNGWAAWSVGSGLADYFPRAMKTAQVLKRMWVQAVKKLGRLKDHVSPSLQALQAFFFLSLSGREWGAKFVPQLSPCVSFCASGSFQ